MILIHTALLCEAQTFIERYKLKKSNDKNVRLYTNEDILLVVSLVGKKNTIDALEYIFTNYHISKAYNIGIAGTNDTSIPIGTLFCTNKILDNIPYIPLITVDNPQTKLLDSFEPVLYDMEGKYFLEIASKYLKQNIYILKIVSDYLDNRVLKKDYIKGLFYKFPNLSFI